MNKEAQEIKIQEDQGTVGSRSRLCNLVGTYSLFGARYYS